MVEKIESYKTKTGQMFPKKEVEEVTTYKTEDGMIFSEKEDAETHVVKLKNKKEFAKTTRKIKQLFKQELAMFADSTNEYNSVSIEDADLECDFWDDEGQALVNASNVDVTIEDFEDYMFLVKVLLEDFHLEKVIKIVKKITHNKETV